MNTSNPRQTHILWGKEGFRSVAPQASAIPGFATARLWKYILHYITTSCVRTSTSWTHFRKAPERPGVTWALPAPYKLADKPAGSGRQTFLEYVLIAPVPCSKLVAIRGRAPGFVLRHRLLDDDDDWRYSPRLRQAKQFVVAHHGWLILMSAGIFRAGRFHCWCRFGSSFGHDLG